VRKLHRLIEIESFIQTSDKTETERKGDQHMTIPIPQPPAPSTNTNKRKILIAMFLVATIAVAAVAMAYIGTGGFNFQGTNPSPSPTASASQTLTPTPISSVSPSSSPTNIQNTPTTQTPINTPTSSPTTIPNTPTQTPINTPKHTPGPTENDVPINSPTITPTLTPYPEISKWNKTYGTAGDEYAYSTVQTSDGGFVIVGCSMSTDANARFVVCAIKIDATGSVVWNNTYGGNHAGGYSVARSNDGGYVIAGLTYIGNQSVYLIKIDALGNMLWNKTYGGTGVDIGYCVIPTNDGGYIIAGYTDSFGNGGMDAYLVKTDSAGNMLWNKTYGGTSEEHALSVVQTSDGGYVIGGDTKSFGSGMGDVYLVKTDSAGNMLWNRTYGGASDDGGGQLVQTGDGGFAITGYYGVIGAGSGDVYLFKTDSSGNMLWNRTYGGTNSDIGHSLIKTSDGGFAILGYTLSFGVGSADVYLIKTDSNGAMSWSKTYGGTNSEAGVSVFQTSDTGYFLAGYTKSFGAGQSDIYLVKTDSVGNT
jgi:hypothetical protein